MKFFFKITSFIKNFLLTFAKFSKNFLFHLALFLKNLLPRLALISLILNQFIFVTTATAQALPIVVDGATNTQVTQTASGIDQINIAPPSANGVSHNKFDEYNVNVAGQVINNFSGKNPAEIIAGSGANSVTQTQIGGLVTANPNLNSTGSAKIILNEVTSGNVSKLLGYTEIAGTKADLILANPNGIACNGCGFINTARLLMVAGKSDFDQSGNLGFKLKEQIDPNLYVPLITIDGLGLDASRVAGAEIVASSVKLLASIYGNKDNSLLIKTGDGKYDYATKNIDSINNEQSNPNSQSNLENNPSPQSSSPVFAIDASALAKIQAGQIYVIATKQGVGVKMANEILASQTLNLEANGDIYYQDIAVGDNVNLKANGTIKNLDSKASILAPNINISAEQFDNSALISAHKLNIKNGKNFNNSGNLEALNLNFANIDNINNSGNLEALNLNFVNIDNINNSGKLEALNLNFANIDNINNSGKFEALNLNFANIDNINNSGSIFGQDNLEISGKNLTNNSVGNIYSPQNYSINLTGLLNNSGLISSKNNLNIETNQLTNNSEISAQNNLTFLITDSATNSGNLIAVNALNFTANSLTNSGATQSDSSSTFNLSSLTNQKNALIYSKLDTTITSTNSLNNSGSILSDANLAINSGLTSNDGEIFAKKDLDLALTNDFNNQGSLSAVGNLTVNSNNAVNNSNQILSTGNLKIVATALNNSSTIQSDGNITVILNNLSNSKNISSNKDLNIVADVSISNSGTMQSVESFDIDTDSFTNLAKSLILAGGNLKIRASALNNQNTKPSNSKVSSGIVSSNGAVDIFADNINNNAGIVIGKSTSVSVLNNANVILENTLGSFISTEAITLNLGNLDYTITGTITASNIDITANNLTNQGNVTASDFIKLNATGISGIAGSGNITNGLANGDNSNILLASGSYIDFIAKNNIENYGMIIATTDTNLTSTYGNINNYSTGKITGGSGTTTINATNGSFNNTNQTSLFTADNDAVFNLKDLNNTGEISIANDLTTNITNNLINNPTALIWSGRDATFNVANTFLNNQADIYADRNLTIQKNTSLDPAQNKTNLVQNISGNIETFSGDINIKAVTLENKRSSMKTQSNAYTDRAWYQQHETHHDTSHTASIIGIAGIVSNISSGKNLNISAINLTNDSSNILSVGNLALNASTINNTSYFFESYYQRNPNWWCGGTCSWRGDWNQIAKQNYYSETYNAYIKAGGLLSGSITSKINNNTILQQSAVSSVEEQWHSTTINKIDSYTLSQTGVLAVDLSSIISAISNSSSSSEIPKSAIANTNEASLASASNTNFIFSGNFKINLDPASTTPLVESRSQFTDISKFFGSSYYFNQLGLNGSSVLADIDGQTRVNNTRMLGDSFVESKLIIDQLKNLTNDSVFLSKDSTDANQQIKELLDNSISQLNNLGLNAQDVAIKGLSKDQVNSLTKDIVTFEVTNVNGVSVLAPKIYLSQNTRNRLFDSNSKTNGKALANSSTIFAKENLTIDSPNSSLTNNGSIASGGNLALNISSLTNKTNSIAQAQIIANNNLSITAQEGDIKNIGANIGAIGSVNLEALNGNILNSAIVQTNDQNLLNQNADSYQLKLGDSAKSSGNITSTLLQDASIKGGSIAINVSNDFTNLGAEISTTKNTLADGSTTSGNLSITAGDDITIGTLELRNRTEARWGSRKKGGTLIIDETKNIGSDIESAGNLSLRTTGVGTNNEKALVDQKFAEAQAVYNNDLTIYDKALEDYPSKLAIYNEQLAFYNSAPSFYGFKRFIKEPTPPEIPLTPKAPVYSQIMASVDNGGSDIKIVGSNISTTTNGSSININANDSVNITSAVDSSYKMETSHKTGILVKKSSININSSTTNIASNINSLGDITITSGNDTDIIASNLSGSNSGLIISGGDTNIYNAEDTSYSYSQTNKTSTGLIRQIPILGSEINVLSKAISPTLSLINGLTGGNLQEIQELSNINYNKNNLDKSSDNEKLVASNLNFGNNLTIGSNADLNLKASNLATISGDILLASDHDVNILSSSQNSISNQNYYDRSDRNKERGNADTTNIINISSAITAGSDLNIISGNNTIIQSSKLSSGDNLTIDSENNILLLTAKDIAIKNETNTGKATYTFSNGNSGHVNIKAVNNEITSNINNLNNNLNNDNIDGNLNPDLSSNLNSNLNPGINSNLSLNANNSILVQYQEGTMESLLSSANNGNQQLAYFKTVNDLSQLNPNKINLDSIANSSKHWDKTTRGLTTASQVLIAVAAVAVAVGTGGLGSGISGAMMTAVATTASTTATISATNASMNTDSNFLNSANSIADSSWKATTSDESLKNMAISAAVAGVASWAVQVSGGTATLEKGKDYAVYKPDPVKMATNSEYRTFVETNYPNYNGVIDPTVNNIGVANTTTDITKIGTPVPPYSTDPFTASFWQGFGKEGGFISNGANQAGGMNSMSLMHDPWAGSAVIRNFPLGTQLSIPPAILVQYCATFPGACGAAVSGSMNNQFGTEK
jgi:filamentous hemagglutinin